jgi:hypothetical protein
MQHDLIPGKAQGHQVFSKHQYAYHGMSELIGSRSQQPLTRILVCHDTTWAIDHEEDRNFWIEFNKLFIHDCQPFVG